MTLGDQDEENGTVAILDGLSYLDCIAFPDETVQVGMLASETAYVPEDLGSMEPMDMGEYDMEGMDFEGADFEGADFEGMDGETDEPQPESQMDIPMGGPIG